MADADASFVSHCLELLTALGRPRSRRMFGGHGIYVDEVFVALIIGEQLYLKADIAARGAFEQAGCSPFEYTTRGGRKAALGYWSAPDEAMESPAAMLPWARLALASALRAAASSRAAPKRSSTAAARKAGAAPKTPAPRKRGA
jgi:DNA transformation protein